MQTQSIARSRLVSLGGCWVEWKAEGFGVLDLLESTSDLEKME